MSRRPEPLPRLALPTRVEQRGIDFVPMHERRSRPLNVGVVLLVANLSFSLIAVGFIPIAIGLSLSQAIATNILGALIGSLAFCGFSLLGARTGTNSPVSTGAFFGVKGRLIGTLVSAFVALGVVAIAVWVSGQFLVATSARVFGTSDSNGVYAVGYALVLLICMGVAIYGHELIVASQRYLLVPVALVILVGFLIMGDRVSRIDTASDASFSAWATALTVGISSAISYCTLVNDYTRYIDPSRFSSRAIAGAAGTGLFVGLAVAMCFGSLMGAISPSLDPVVGAAQNLPLWYVIFLCLVAVCGGFGQAGTALYSTGLDLSSVIPRLTRPVATAAMSGVVIALVYLGAFVWDALGLLVMFIAILVALAVPWITISYAGMLVVGNRYQAQDLQVFMRGQSGGSYWYSDGWSFPAVGAWLFGSVVAVCFVATDTYVGFGGGWFGFDASIPMGALASLLALGLLSRDRETWHPWRGTPTETALTSEP